MFVYFNCTRFRPGCGHVSDVEQEVHDVAVLHDDYVALGSEKACRDAGKLSIEGKEYVVEDGDIMHFLFNV